MNSQARSHLLSETQRGCSPTNKEDETLEPSRLPIPMQVQVRRVLTARQIAKLLEEENIWEFEPWQCFNLPYNITK